MEKDTTTLDAGRGDSPNPWSDDDDEINCKKLYTVGKAGEVNHSYRGLVAMFRITAAIRSPSNMASQHGT
jgi:hypothetical protein